MLKTQPSCSRRSSFELLLDSDLLADAQRMSFVYTAIHTFENTVRQLVMKAMAERHGAASWAKAPDRISKNGQDFELKRMQSSGGMAHGAVPEINYCDFGDLSSIIVTNWDVFEDVVANLEWAKGVLSTLEKSRNIVMHGGVLAKEDIERVGMNIRDWIRQTG